MWWGNPCAHSTIVQGKPPCWGNPLCPQWYWGNPLCLHRYWGQPRRTRRVYTLGEEKPLGEAPLHSILIFHFLLVWTCSKCCSRISWIKQIILLFISYILFTVDFIITGESKIMGGGKPIITGTVSLIFYVKKSAEVTKLLTNNQNFAWVKE